MTRTEAQERMEELVHFFSHLEKLEESLGELGLEATLAYLPDYAKELSRTRKKVEKLKKDLALDIAVAQIRIDARMK